MITTRLVRPHRLKSLRASLDVNGRSSSVATTCCCSSFSSVSLRSCPTAVLPNPSSSYPRRRTTLPAGARFINRYAKTVPLAPPITEKTRLTENPVDEECLDYDKILFIDEKGQSNGIVDPRTIIDSYDRGMYHLVMINAPSVKAAEEKLAAGEFEINENEEGKGEATIKIPTPICKLFAKSELRLELIKKREALLQKKPKIPEQVVKELQVGWAITQNDLTHRLKRMSEFLSKGNKVVVMIAPKKKMTLVEPERLAEILEAFRTAAQAAGGTESKAMEGEAGSKVMLHFQGKKPEGEVVKEKPKEERARKAMERKEKREQKAREAAEAAEAAKAAAEVELETIEATTTTTTIRAPAEAQKPQDPWKF